MRHIKYTCDLDHWCDTEEWGNNEALYFSAQLDCPSRATYVACTLPRRLCLPSHTPPHSLRSPRCYTFQDMLDEALPPCGTTLSGTFTASWTAFLRPGEDGHGTDPRTYIIILSLCKSWPDPRTYIIILCLCKSLARPTDLYNYTVSV